MSSIASEGVQVSASQASKLVEVYDRLQLCGAISLIDGAAEKNWPILYHGVSLQPAMGGLLGGP